MHFMWTFVGTCSIIYLTGVVVAVMVCVCVGGVFVCVYFVCVCVCVYSKLSQNALGQTVPRTSKGRKTNILENAFLLAISCSRIALLC